MGNAVRFAVCSGDISYLHELSEIEQLTDGSVDAMTAGQALNVLDESGMIKHVAAHQRIVSEVLEGVQSWIGAAPIGESSGSVIIEVERYLQFGVADRQVLRRQITGRTRRVLRRSGVGSGTLYDPSAHYPDRYARASRSDNRRMISADQMLDDVRQLLNVVPHEARKRTIMSRAYYAAYHFLLKHACCRTYVRTPGVGSHRDLLNFLGRSPELNVRHAASVLGDLYARRITADYRIDNHILALLSG